jgi:hypothetical protein
LSVDIVRSVESVKDVPVKYALPCPAENLMEQTGSGENVLKVEY